MKQVQLGRMLTVVTLTAAFAVGCQASGSLQAGGGTTPTNAPPPPPPPTATATTPPPADPPKADPPKGESKIKGDVKGSRVNIPGHIVFDSAKSTIKIKESEAVLNQLKQFMTDNPQVTLLRVEGHTDSDGDDNMNLKLSGERALAVVAWLVTQGISRDRLLAVGFGETKPIVANDTPANKEQNRRTEFHMAAIDGKNFLGRDPVAGGTVYKLSPSLRPHAAQMLASRALARAPVAVCAPLPSHVSLALPAPSGHGARRCAGSG